MEAAVAVKACPYGQKDEACTCGSGGACEKGPTMGERVMEVVRGHGSLGATAAEIAADLRAGSMLRPRMPDASAPKVLAKLEKMARHGAVRVEYSSVREGNMDTAARFFP